MIGDHTIVPLVSCLLHVRSNMHHNHSKSLLSEVCFLCYINRLLIRLMFNPGVIRNQASLLPNSTNPVATQLKVSPHCSNGADDHHQDIGLFDRSLVHKHIITSPC
mmetsp:Transcript_33885/g.79828  ORF Transcript_33885/g.79828 Transcript_33885/m.79828 type:complete len:106 (+) Transcript_33885:85-402(+)